MARTTVGDLACLGWDDERALQYSSYDRPGHLPGRAMRVDRGIATVMTSSGVVRASLGGNLLASAAADRTALPIAGDWLVLRRWSDHRVTIEAVLPRRPLPVPCGDRVVTVDFRTRRWGRAGVFGTSAG
jgi:hypothetical protein